jgi:hypothetical protein
MGERHYVEADYRGRRVEGEWYIEDGELHVVSVLGRDSSPAGTMGGRIMQLPSERAVKILQRIARAADPNPSFFYWK